MSKAIIKLLRVQVLQANLELPKYKLVTFTWGNVSQIHRETNLVAIKPSGVEYDVLKEEDIVILDLDGKIIEGTLNPSSDTPTHLELYRKFVNIAGIVHTHSPWATSWAQAGKALECYGTTHADYFYGSVPCTRQLHQEEVENDYELNTGKVIVETFEQLKLNPIEMPGVLVRNHGPFAWGKDAQHALHNAVVLEEVAKMNLHTLQIRAGLDIVGDVASEKRIAGGKSATSDKQSVGDKTFRTPQYVMNKHYQRKHGKDAYYGQKK